ncbi:MAG: hypothetical protein ACR2PX_22410 [Endozoicomonas sp.]|uniref:hypothetical protein n=1 Tax=Gammaproteobacteria TaxID=1236 RepID=UPI00110B7C21|nr:hypothetical protein [Pseudoalteromonas sp. S4492]TMO21197.1 hypothetical protein CWC28_21565 [Pseudoalteromonas sp. S4492]
MSNKDKQLKKDFLQQQVISRDDLPNKGSKRALKIRRALEDREETKKLSTFFGDSYWGDV